MIRFLFCIVLAVIAVQNPLLAQYENLPKRSKSDRMFNEYPPFVNHVHTAHLQKNEKMIVELANLTDYDMLGNLDSVLSVFMKDIAFYKDSIPPAGNVRIDYAITEDNDQRMIRVKKYNSDGDLFVVWNNETSRLKLEQDTVHIIFKKKPNDRSNHAHFYDFPVQVTFCLNNYTDIDSLIRSRGLLKAITDTLAKAITPSKINPEMNFKYGGETQSTINYYPYNVTNKMQKSDYLIPISGFTPASTESWNRFALKAKLGAGIIGNTLAPMAEIGLQYNRFWGRGSGNVNIFRISAAPYFLFDRREGGAVINDNWFVTGLFGSIYHGNHYGWLGKEVVVGAGYLVIQKGDYFKNTTFKVFTDIMLMEGLTISPELIFTDNCQQIYPGITLKVF